MVADVGARIRSLRTAKGMTQAQVAEPNYTKAYISMLESGRTRASMKALEHIAGVLGVKPADLLAESRRPQRLSTSCSRLAVTSSSNARRRRSRSSNGLRRGSGLPTSSCGFAIWRSHTT